MLGNIAFIVLGVALAFCGGVAVYALLYPHLI